MAGFRKRVRANAPFKRMVRRRRTGRFKGRSRTSRSGTVRTGYTAANSNITFKKKRFNRRQWKRDLYKHTQFKQTFRSVNNGLSSITTPASIAAVNNATFGLANGVIGGGIAPFWTVAGGAIPVDQGGVVPIFSPSSIILKGGMSKLTLTSSTVDPVKVKVWAVWAKSRPDYTNNVPATNSAVPHDWDPTMHPDFHESFTVLFGREVILLAGQRPFEMSYRYKCRKIDVDEFGIEGGNQLIWMFTAAETVNFDAAGSAIQVLNSHNLAFVGDAST